MKIIIETIPHKQHRYSTLGDYFEDAEGTYHILVSALRDPRAEWAIAIHELVEYALCLIRNIPEENILAFDKAHPELDEPGDDPEAPYYNEHRFATFVERAFVFETGMLKRLYDTVCEEPFR